MEFKGTKGKWEIKHSESKDAFNIVGTILGGHYKIARIPYLVTETLIEVNNREKKEAESNAKLIASAPELLEALQAMLSRFEHVDNDMIKSTHVKDMARKAIEKALT